MSEYQYYKFKAIDKPLTTEEKKIISSWSSRTTVRGNEAQFDYNYGDFPKEEIDVVEKYFDFMLYTANWGDVRLIYKFPKDLVSKKSLRQFSVDDRITTIELGNYIILDIYFSFDDGMEDWIYGDEIDTAALCSLRNDIISGDYSSLYLAWLHLNISKEEYLFTDIDQKTKIPYDNVGIDKSSNNLSTFIEMFSISQEIVSNAKTNDSKKYGHDYSELLYMMSNSDKIIFLDRLLFDEPLLKSKLEQHLKQYSYEDETSELQSRTISEFNAEIETKRLKKYSEDKIKREAKKLRKLETLEKEEPEMWVYIHRLIKERKTKSYDEAVKILKELKQLAKHKNKQNEFTFKIGELKEDYSRLSALKQRIDKIM